VSRGHAPPPSMHALPFHAQGGCVHASGQAPRRHGGAMRTPIPGKQLISPPFPSWQPTLLDLFLRSLPPAAAATSSAPATATPPTTPAPLTTPPLTRPTWPRPTTRWACWWAARWLTWQRLDKAEVGLGLGTARHALPVQGPPPEQQASCAAEGTPPLRGACGWQSARTAMLASCSACCARP
jgi:hypothetical protein